MRPAPAYEPAYELPPHAPAPADAVEAAEGGEVVYLTRDGERVAAVVPPEVAAAGAGAVIALEDAADLREARQRLVEARGAGEEPIPHQEMVDQYRHVLAAHPADDR